MRHRNNDTLRTIKLVISFVIGVPLAILLLFSLGSSPMETISNMIGNISGIIEWFNR